MLVPLKEIITFSSNGKASIRFDTGDYSSCVFNTRLGGLGGVISLNIEQNGNTSFTYKNDLTDCSVSNGVETCIRVQETHVGGTVDVKGTLFEQSIEDGVGVIGIRDVQVNTLTVVDNHDDD